MNRGFGARPCPTYVLSARLAVTLAFQPAGREAFLPHDGRLESLPTCRQECRRYVPRRKHSYAKQIRPKEQPQRRRYGQRNGTMQRALTG